MPLTTDERKAAARHLANRIFTRANRTANMDTDDLVAAVAAADDWLDSVAATYNLALPLAFRTKATAAQKTMLLAALCMKRAGVE